ncbi:hypothetical protein ISN44_As11g009000 [Arabidopsis suecica]|uniref:Uncharacterized protein n=1 Tax=Arabidopsis suecica TaxID=45249 RepID=A0A8T1Z8L8_ARASU|nr:hypothetical protein ISN44_As11g009000 [Arabidopsis suecica]
MDPIIDAIVLAFANHDFEWYTREVDNLQNHFETQVAKTGCMWNIRDDIPEDIQYLPPEDVVVDLNDPMFDNLTDENVLGHQPVNLPLPGQPQPWAPGQGHGPPQPQLRPPGQPQGQPQPLGQPQGQARPPGPPQGQPQALPRPPGQPQPLPRPSGQPQPLPRPPGQPPRQPQPVPRPQAPEIQPQAQAQPQFRHSNRQRIPTAAKLTYLKQLGNEDDAQVESEGNESDGDYQPGA